MYYSFKPLRGHSVSMFSQLSCFCCMKVQLLGAIMRLLPFKTSPSSCFVITKLFCLTCDCQYVQFSRQRLCWTNTQVTGSLCHIISLWLLTSSMTLKCEITWSQSGRPTMPSGFYIFMISCRLVQFITL